MPTIFISYCRIGIRRQLPALKRALPIGAGKCMSRFFIPEYGKINVTTEFELNGIYMFIFLGWMGNLLSTILQIFEMIYLTVGTS